MFNDTPYFSVVLITYNRVDLLPRCIDSVLNQSFKNIELIIVDNHSEDGSISLINEYISRDPRVHLVLVHNNNILAYSRNEGIKCSRGKYICILDSDDWYTTDKLQCIYDVLQQKEYDVVYNKYTIMSEKGKGRILGKSLKWSDTFHELLINGAIICNTTVVVKKDVIEMVGYLSENPKLRAVEDLDLWLRLSRMGCSFHFVDKMLGYYWVGDNMSYSPQQIQRLNNLYDIHLPYVDLDKKSKVELCRIYTNGRTYHKIGFWNEAKSAYVKTFVHSSLSRKVNIVLLFFLASLKIKI